MKIAYVYNAIFFVDLFQGVESRVVTIFVVFGASFAFSPVRLAWKLCVLPQFHTVMVKIAVERLDFVGT